MRIFVYEFICGGGLWALDETPGGSLLEEGRGMLRALVSDLAEVPGVEVAVTRDGRVSAAELALPGNVYVEVVGRKEHERPAINQLARSAHATILIAPEFFGMLAERCGWVTSAG